MKRAMFGVGFLVVGLSAAGCVSDPVGPVQYHENVAPILQERCAGCHSLEGVGPFPLDTYDSALAFSAVAVEAARSRAMPPWQVKADGSCQEFQHSEWLADEEISTLQNWVRDGLLEGDPANHPAPLPSQPGLEDAELFTMPAPYLPIAAGSSTSENDDYRCFAIDNGQAGDRVVTAFEVLPGDPKQVHHVLVFTLDPEFETEDGRTNAEVINDLKAVDPSRGGWECYAAAGEGTMINDLALAWAPGSRVGHYPTGTGVAIPAGHIQVMQVHYNLAGTGDWDQTGVKLQYGNGSEKYATTLLLDRFLETVYNPDLPVAELPPGQDNVPFTWNIQAAEMAYFQYARTGNFPDGFDLLGIFPHMHELGRSMSMSINRDAATECGAEVPNWNFEWQRFYFYKEPISIDMNVDIDVTCNFDTSAQTDPVLPGFGTSNEMCLMGLYVSPR